MSTISTVASQTSNTSSGGGALASLDSNFQDFLGMLMTQLQNQDPTSPMDTNQFTSELVQFSSVEQQINTNSNLEQLISLTQSGQVIQGSSLVGKTVQASTSSLPLQDGKASLSYTTTSAGTAKISISDSAGDKVYSTSVDASSGINSWTWNGKTAAGKQLSDGTYTVSITGPGSNGASTTLTPTVSGKVTGVSKNGSIISLDMGKASINFSDVTSVSSS